MGDIEMMRGIVRHVPRSYEVIVRDRVKFRVGHGVLPDEPQQRCLHAAGRLP